MDKIEAINCETNKWYEHDTWGRVLCCGCVNKTCYQMAFAVRPTGDRLKVMGETSTSMKFFCDEALFTPLPDCTGWDWQPPPKYRPFRDAWEFVESAKGRRIACQSGTMEITAVDFEEHPLCVNICGGWYSLKALCDQFIFEDTGSPCGVRL
jgi:hypothetical protein